MLLTGHNLCRCSSACRCPCNRCNRCNRCSRCSRCSLYSKMNVSLEPLKDEFENWAVMKHAETNMFPRLSKWTLEIQTQHGDMILLLSISESSRKMGRNRPWNLHENPVVDVAGYNEEKGWGHIACQAGNFMVLTLHQTYPESPEGVLI